MRSEKVKSARPARAVLRMAALAVLGASPSAWAAKPALPDVLAPAAPTAPATNPFFSWYVHSVPEPAAQPRSSAPSAIAGTSLAFPLLAETNAQAVRDCLVRLSSTKAITPPAGAGPNTLSLAPSSLNYVLGNLDGAAGLLRNFKNRQGLYRARPGSLNVLGGDLGSVRPGLAATSYPGLPRVYSSIRYPRIDSTKLALSGPAAFASGAGFRPMDSARISAITLPLEGFANSPGGSGLTNVQELLSTSSFNAWNNLALAFEGGGQSAMFNGTGYRSPERPGNQSMPPRDTLSMGMPVRMRGADAFHVLDSGIVSTSNPELEAALAGWIDEQTVQSIFNEGDPQAMVSAAPGLDSIDAESWLDAARKHLDMAFSSAYRLSLKRLDTLFDLDEEGSTVAVPDAVGGYALVLKDGAPTQSTHIRFDAAIGSNPLAVGVNTASSGPRTPVEYTLDRRGRRWGVAGQHVPFAAIASTQSPFGVPDPGTLSLLAVAGVFGLNRRRQQS